MSLLNRGLRSRARRLTPSHVHTAVTAARRGDMLMVDWVNRGPAEHNWGDAIAPVIVEFLAGKPAANQRDVFNIGHNPVYSTIGSMMGTVDVANWEVWGSGFVDSGATLKVRPHKIHAVRGPLTQQKLREAEVDCPSVFGDPALLFPLLYNPAVVPDQTIGVIPHYKEKNLRSVANLVESGVHLLDIEAGTWDVVEQIKRCSLIVSSSLHGLVAAHAYGVPALWVRFSDRPAGDGFKFRDYLASVGLSKYRPITVTDSTRLNQITDLFEGYSVDLDLSTLLKSCPFMRPSLESARLHSIARSI